MAEPTNAEGRALLSIIERIERLEEDKKQVAADIKEIYAEAKGNGYDAKVLREIVRRRAEDAAKRSEFETVLDLYLGALGALADTPLGQAAVAREVTSTQRIERQEALQAEAQSSEDRFDAEEGQVAANTEALENGIKPLPASATASDCFKRGRVAYLKGAPGMVPDDLQGRDKVKLADEYLRGWSSVAEMPVADRAALRRAIDAFGNPVELTSDERDKGMSAAFMRGDTRITIGATGA